MNIFGETPSGAVDGLNAAFVLANTPTAGTVSVYLNGARQAITTDYTFAGATITFVSAPLVGSILLADYSYLTTGSMSVGGGLTVSDAIASMQSETSTIGQRISEYDFMLALNRANKHFMTGYKMPTTEREQDFRTFSGVYEYPLPSDFAGIIPLRRPMGSESPDFSHETPRGISRWPYGRKTALKHNRGTPYLMVLDSEGSSLPLHNCDSLTDNGTWAVTGDGSGLVLDKQVYQEGTGSLKFTVTGSGGTTTLTNPALDFTLDITDYLNNGWVFCNLQCPASNTSAVASVEIRLGSSATDYYSITATTRFRGDTIYGGWGLVGGDISDATTTGTPTDTAISYVKVIVSNPVTGGNGAYRLDDIFLGQTTYYQMPYYSSENIQDTTGAYKENITVTSDVILCPVEFKEAYIYKALHVLAVERLQDAGLANFFLGELREKEPSLKSKYPVQESKPSTNYYSRVGKF
ncbi:MAG: hypothetical protein WC763_05240 [Candidatus Paceibacterota bacterium]|jgi:hypothetical protein